MKGLTMGRKATEYVFGMPGVSLTTWAMLKNPNHAFVLLVAIVMGSLLFLIAIRRYSPRFAVQTLFGIAKRRQVEMMKAHMAVPVRKRVEIGDYDFEQQTVMSDAVVGIVDIVGSTKISMSVDLNADFHMKKQFLKIAANAAHRHQITILNHTGDGFLFLGNYENPRDWQRNVLAFADEMISEFETLIHETGRLSGLALDSGLRFGISRGDVILGCLGASPAHFTAVGAQVNMAARLAGTASKNEMVFSASAWNLIRAWLPARFAKTRRHELKGCESATVGVHISRECLVSNRLLMAE